MNLQSPFFLVLVIISLLFVSRSPAGSARADSADQPPKPSSKKQDRNRKALEKELDRPFEKWVREDVADIITDEERAAWRRLGTAEEHEQFIEQFWINRDPTQDTPENEYKEEHYRRIAYANEHFSSGIPGSKTDRGRIYILHGPPDEIESHPAGGAYERSAEEGGGHTETFPFERWRYRHVPGVDQDVVLEFVDRTMTGEYRLTMDPSEKDALLHVPNAGLTWTEQMGLSQKSDRLLRTDPPGGLSARNSAFERLRIFNDMQRPPAKFRDLEAVAEGRTQITIRYNLLPFQVRLDFIKITGDTVLAALTVLVANKDMTFESRNGVQHALVNVFGRVSTMTRRVVQTFEDVVQLDIPAELMPQQVDKASVYWQALPLRPGLYRLNLVLKDVVSGNMGTLEKALTIPSFDEEDLSASSLILADKIEKVSTKDLGRGQFVIGSTRLRPSVSSSFRRDDRLGLYLQVYNLRTDEKTHHPAATVEYAILDRNTQPVLEVTEKAGEVPGASGKQLTLEKMLTLKGVQPGKYTLRVKVTDHLARKSIAPTAAFVVQ